MSKLPEPVAWQYTSKLSGDQRYLTRFRSHLDTYKADKVWPLYTADQMHAYRAQALEEAARVCDALDVASRDPLYCAGSAEECAAAIRVLKGTP